MPPGTEPSGRESSRMAEETYRPSPSSPGFSFTTSRHPKPLSSKNPRITLREVEKVRTIPSASLLVLTLTFVSMPAHATPIFYNFGYVPNNPFGGGNVFLDVTVFLDSSLIPTTGTATVVPTKVDVLFRTNSTNAVFSTFANDQTAVLPGGPLMGTARVPYSFEIDPAGSVTRQLQGLQRLTNLSGGNCTALGDCGIELLQFAMIQGGTKLGGITYFTAEGGGPPFSGVSGADFKESFLNTTTGPAVIPEPSTHLLLGLGLAAIATKRRRA